VSLWIFGGREGGRRQAEMTTPLPAPRELTRMKKRAGGRSRRGGARPGHQEASGQPLAPNLSGPV